MTEFLNNLLFIFQRFDALSAVDILLVTLVFFALMYWLRDTQAMILLRGVILIVVALVLLTSLANLPAFSWLVRNSIPAMLLAIPVIFAPEIRRALERIGRAGTLLTRFSNTSEIGTANGSFLAAEIPRGNFRRERYGRIRRINLCSHHRCLSVKYLFFRYIYSDYVLCSGSCLVSIKTK